MQGSKGWAALWVAAIVGCVAEEPPAPRAEESEEPPLVCAEGEADCPPGYACRDAPDDGCEPEIDGVCPQACQWAQCAGLLGLICPAGQTCIDDPRDECDPKHGGADCGGLCVAPTDPRAPTRPLTSVVPARSDDPRRSYVSRDPALCGPVQFLCAPDWLPFFDACGCGCVLP